MEPRIAGSVSTNATDTQESPQGTAFVTAGIAPQLFRDLFYSRADASQLFFLAPPNSHFMINVVECCSRVETAFTLID